MGGGHPESAAPARRQLLPQHRHDLGAEELDLLERELDRETDAVEREELALVVAEPFLEGHDLVDDLLRAADRERGGAFHEVLERAALKSGKFSKYGRNVFTASCERFAMNACPPRPTIA